MVVYIWVKEEPKEGKKKMKNVWILTRGGESKEYENVTYLNVYVSGGITNVTLFIGDELDPIYISNVLDVTADRN